MTSKIKFLASLNIKYMKSIELKPCITTGYKLLYSIIAIITLVFNLNLAREMDYL